MLPWLTLVTALSMLGILTLGYFGWKHWQHSTIEELVPDQSIALFQIPNVGRTKELLAETSVGQSLLGVAELRSAYQSLQRLDSVSSAIDRFSPEWSGFLSKALYKSPLWLSVQRYSKYELGWLAYVQLPRHSGFSIEEGRGFWVENKEAGKWRVRKYRSHEIHEWLNTGDEQPSWAISKHKDFILISHSPILVELSLIHI